MAPVMINAILIGLGISGRDDRVPYRYVSGQSGLDDIAGIDRTHSGRRPGKDQVAFLECKYRREIMDEVGDAEEHLRRRSPLTLLTVDPADEIERRDGARRVGWNNVRYGGGGVESLGDGPGEALLFRDALNVPESHIETHPESKDDTGRGMFGDVFHPRADRDHQFDLMMHFTRKGGAHDGVRGMGDSG